MSRILAVLVSTVLAFAVLGILGWLVVSQMTSLAAQLPQYEQKIQKKLNSVNDRLGSVVRKLTRTAEADVSKSEKGAEPAIPGERSYLVRVMSPPASPMHVVTGMFGTLLEVLGSTGIVIVLSVFFLVRREDLRDRFIRLVGKGDVTVTTQAIEDAVSRVTRYLSMQFLMNALFGLSVGIGIYLIGLPSAFLWGILAMILRFVPYVGTWIAAAAPIGLSIAISTGWLTPILTTALFAGLELSLANFLEPWLYGKNTGVSPVAVLVAAVFWTWLWGTIGLLLSTPLTVCLLVIGRYVPQLSSLVVLLGDEQVFEPKTRVYQRLLAGDQEEAAQLIEGYLEHMSLVEVFDTVLIPALALAQMHWRRGEIDEERHKFILENLKETVEELDERQHEVEAKQAAETANMTGADSRLADTPHASRLSVLCLPARDEADEIAGMMLAQLLASRGCIVESVPVASLASEMVERVEESKADIVCISAMPPAAARHARYLCKRLEGRMSEPHLIVGLWNATGDLNREQQRLGCGPTTHVVGTLAAAQEKINGLPKPLLNREGSGHENVLIGSARS